MARALSSNVTFRCEPCTVTVTYLGRRRWQLSGRHVSWWGPHEAVASAIREALRLAGEIPYDTKVVDVIADATRGKIKNNTFPTHLWWMNLDGERPSTFMLESLDSAAPPALRSAPC